MLHASIASRWSEQPGLVQSIRSWTWCREALPTLIELLARREEVGGAPTVDVAALARAFWSWAVTLDSNAPLEPLDPIDYAHYSVGMLLSQILHQRPLRLPGAQRSEEVRVLTDTALTLLAAWRKALGAAPLDDDLQECSGAGWSSYVENIAEDPRVAVAFLDKFTGRTPVWSFPTTLVERPPFRSALAKRRNAAG